MNSLKITYSQLSIFLITIFILRGVSQSLYSIKILNETTILHFFSFVMLIMLAFVFFNAILKARGIKSEHILLALGSVYYISISFINGYFNVTDFISYIMPIIAFIGLFELRKSANFIIIVKFTAIVFFLQVATLLAVKGFHGIVAREGREGLGSLFGHANSLALMAASFFIIFQNKNIYSNIKGNKALINLMFFLTIGIIGARSMVMSIAIGYLFWLVLKPKYTPLKVYAMFILYFVLISFIVSYGYSLLESSWDTQSYTSGNSLKWRVIHWEYYIDKFNSIFDFLIGFGIGSHEVVTAGVYFKYLEVHNDILRITYDTGIFGLLIYFCFDFSITKKIKNIIDLDWRYYLLIATKYFFMFFDNYVTNMLSVTGMAMIIIMYVRKRENEIRM